MIQFMPILYIMLLVYSRTWKSTSLQIQRCMRDMHKSVSLGLEAGDAYEDAHRRKTVQVSRVWQRLFTKGHIKDTHDSSYGKELIVLITI